MASLGETQQTSIVPPLAQHTKISSVLRFWIGFALMLAIWTCGILLHNTISDPSNRWLGDCLCFVAGSFSTLGWWIWWRHHTAKRNTLHSLPFTAQGLSTALESGLHKDSQWQQFSAGMLIPLHFNPVTAHLGAGADLNAHACIERLVRLHDTWHLACQQQYYRTQRRLWLDKTLAIFEYGSLDTPFQNQATDLPTLYTEHMLLKADPGPNVLKDVAALFARRIWLSFQQLSTLHQQWALQQWRFLLTSCTLAKDAQELHEQSCLICDLAQSDAVDIGKIRTAYVLAEQLRNNVESWLTCAKQLHLSDDEPLKSALSTACTALHDTQSIDDIAYMHTLQNVFTQFFNLHLYRILSLVKLAQQVEDREGITSLVTYIQKHQAVT